MGKSEMADIRDYRAENPASGPGMYCNELNQWIVDDSIRLEAGADADDAIEL
eukprot:COSAG06_NODE_339_length_17218_cov_1405.741866_2_plen_52_part_00